MRFVADEGLDAPIVSALRAAGHDVTYVAEVTPGIDDEAVLALANDLGAVLMTADKDFGELVFARGRRHHGVLLVRLHGIPAARKAEIILAAVRERGAQMPTRFATIDDRGVRITARTPRSPK